MASLPRVAGYCLASALLAPGLCSTPAIAQPVPDAGIESPASEDEVIIVTAQKRPERIEVVPISVTALDEGSLERTGADDIDDFVRSVPNLVLQPVENGASFLAIRGVYSSIGAATVGVYLDETPVQINQRGGSGNAQPKLFDLDRIEVLRGPQGTLYGASSLGGTLRYITRQPSLTEWSSRGVAEFATTEGGGESWQVAGAVGGPIAEDRLGFRATAYYRRDGGYVDKIDRASGEVVDRNINDERTVALRGAVTVRLSDAFRATASLFFQQIDSDDLPIYDRPGEAAPAPFVKFQQGFQVPQAGRDRFLLPALTIEGDLGDVSLTSVSSIFRRNDRRTTDFSSTAAEFILIPILGPSFTGVESEGGSASTITNRQRIVTQELRLASNDPAARLQWTMGAFYQKSKLFLRQDVAEPGLDALLISIFGDDVGGVLGIPLLPGGLTYTASERFDEEHIAAFGEATFDLTPQIEFVAGARLSRTNTLIQTQGDGLFNGGPTAPADAVPRTVSETPLTPRLGLNYRPTRDSFLYLSASKGYRSGSGNVPVPTLPCAADLDLLGLDKTPLSYKSDSLWNYEAGYKGRPVRGLSVAAAAFQIDWSDIQQFVYLPICGFGFVANIGQARIRGLEAEVSARPLEGLHLTAAIGYARARFSRTVALGSGLPVAEKGERLPYVPDWTANATAEYRFRLGAIPAYARLDYQYRGGIDRVTVGVPTSPFISRQEAYSYVTARTGVTLDGWEAALFVENLFDVSPDIYRCDCLTPISRSRARDISLRPRTFGLTVSRDF
ncbi:MAG TPA: TonB-dependent receptor [Allosphingosinicella sp.]|nr:TonB-dependent receptor [Allosphingosinicella sp.]